MKISTSRFGEIEFRDEVMLRFPSGIIGFPQSTRYIILDHDREAPFKWLQSADEGGLAFVIMDPRMFKPDYRVMLEPAVLADLGSPADEELILFVLLTVPPGDPDRITANLRAPVVVHEPTRLAKQIILHDDLPTRYPLFAQPVACP
ncbi:MAG: flagellar assembly protein FliW [Nitrospirota bacterium]|nr:flagellar assembly protein FliW [Nitrospirota bacterium]MDE3241108.1 flagellar assembly protein FliW [Nitrospirota bacterium]